MTMTPSSLMRRRLIPGGLLLLFLLTGAAAAPAASQAPAGKLLVLLLIDTGSSESLMPDVQRDEKNLHRLLASLPADRQQIEVLHTAEAPPKQLEERILDHYR